MLWEGVRGRETDEKARVGLAAVRWCKVPTLRSSNAPRTSDLKLAFGWDGGVQRAVRCGAVRAH